MILTNLAAPALEELHLLADFGDNTSGPLIHCKFQLILLVGLVSTRYFPILLPLRSQVSHKAFKACAEVY